jgi:hypothetical protein
MMRLKERLANVLSNNSRENDIAWTCIGDLPLFMAEETLVMTLCSDDESDFWMSGSQRLKISG